MGAVGPDAVPNTLVLGELSLHGGIEPVSGVLPAAMAAVAAGQDLICPAKCGPEAAWADALSIIAPPDLMSLLNHLRGGQFLAPPQPELLPPAHSPPDMRDLRGQETARRVLEIAAAGRHNLLMVGPPGAGKSMLAARLPGLLPPLSPREAQDVTMLHSIAGQLPSGGLIQTRPFRDPHHSASMAALLAAGRVLSRAKLPCRIAGFCFWMSWRNLQSQFWMRSASRLKPVPSLLRGRTIM
jgi:magnesium chelatase family protein